MSTRRGVSSTRVVIHDQDPRNALKGSHLSNRRPSIACPQGCLPYALRARLGSISRPCSPLTCPDVPYQYEVGTKTQETQCHVAKRLLMLMRKRLGEGRACKHSKHLDVWRDFWRWTPKRRSTTAIWTDNRQTTVVHRYGTLARFGCSRPLAVLRDRLDDDWSYEDVKALVLVRSRSIEWSGWLEGKREDGKEPAGDSAVAGDARRWLDWYCMLTFCAGGFTRTC